jgi:hypothetical protein
LRGLASAAAAFALLSSGGARALADEPPDPPATEAATPQPEPVAPTTSRLTDYTGRALSPRRGRIAAHGDLLISLSKDAIAKPIAVVPALFYGVTDSMAVGVTTNVFSETWGFGDGLAGTRGVCLGGTDRGCEKVFNNLSADALYTFLRQPGTEAAAHFGFDVLRISDPSQLGFHAGFQAKLTGGPLSVLIDPSVIVGLTKRDELLEQAIVVPIRVGFQASPDFNVGFVTGLAGTTNHFSEDYVIPVGITGLFNTSANIDLGAHFTFPNLAGNNHSTDARVLGLVFNYRT